MIDFLPHYEPGFPGLLAVCHFLPGSKKLKVEPIIAERSQLESGFRYRITIILWADKFT
jgi:hypothetical protein